VYPLVVRRDTVGVRLRLVAWTPALMRPMLANSSLFFLIGIGLIVDRSAGNLLMARYGTLAAVPAAFAVLTVFRVLGWTLVDLPSRLLQPYFTMLAAQGREERVKFYAALVTKLSVLAAAVLVAMAWYLAEAGIGLWLGAAAFPGYAALALLATA